MNVSSPPHAGQTSANPLRTIAMGAGIWVIVGVPVAGMIAASRVFVWVVFSLPEMIATAAVLGAVQGLWLYLAEQVSAEGSGSLRWLGGVFGGALGLLGFPPVFSGINGVVPDRIMVGVDLLAAVCGGIAAGLALAGSVRARRSPRLAPGRSAVVGCLLLLPLGALDYGFFWAQTEDRLPVPRVSHHAVTNPSAGNASGSMWTGCYQYLGHFSRGSGVLGGEGGQMKVEQQNGSLRVLDISGGAGLGGADRDGRFWFGAEWSAPDRDVLRVLWEGKFHDDSFNFARRITVLHGSRVLNTTRLVGTAARIACDR